jgi:hypothetical protein
MRSRNDERTQRKILQVLCVFADYLALSVKLPRDLRNDSEGVARPPEEIDFLREAPLQTCSYTAL